MADINDYGTNKNSIVLEGIYKSIIGKIDEAKAELSKEMGFGSAQQVSTYEALMESVRKGVDTLLAEMKFLSQQSSAIYDSQEESQKTYHDELLSALTERAEAAEQAIAELNRKLDAVKEAIPAAVDYDLIAEKVALRLNPPVEEGAEETAAEELADEGIDYDVLAEKIASILPEVDYDAIAEKVSAVIPEVDYDTIYERVVAAYPATDYEALADSLASSVPLTDYDLIAEKVVERLNGEQAEENAEVAAEEAEVVTPAEEEVSEESAEEAKEEPAAATEEVTEATVSEEAPAAVITEAAEEPADEKPAEEKEEKIVERVVEKAVEPDYDALAEKIAAKLPKEDADQLATLIAAGIIASLPKGVDEESIQKTVSESIAAAMAEKFDITVDEEGIAKLAAAVTEALDYRVIAERLAELLHGDEEELEQLASPAPVEEESAAEEPVEETVAEVEEAEPVAEEEPVEVETEQEEELAAAEAVKAEEEEDPAVGITTTVDDPNLMLRLKRSFIAKVIQSDDDVKHYYGELKNELLAYTKVRSQVSWSNDRFTKSRETLVKIGIRGKTLCVYLALNPDEFPITVYHQKFAGDTKMYEKTPMMVKVKSGVALKRAIRLIEILMEREETKKNESFKPVDYSGMYKYKSDAALLDEGLIKTTVVERVDLNFD